MVLNDPIADAMSKINNSVGALNKSVLLKKSKLLINVLEVLKRHGYVGSYEIVENSKQDMIKVNLLGTINKCGVIKPRYSLKVDEIESFEQKFLPAKDFGVIIISTNKGLRTQFGAKEDKIGGTLIAYCY
ncbi:MAG: 30S ribosomal protein S8 [Nanoarchaeota archaeon]|nr:30S ribosomal protein S8 [Nanoarchaeota archaeon]